MGASKTSKYRQRRLQGKDGFPCPYCLLKMTMSFGARQPTTDHVLAKARKPRGSEGRTLIVCYDCNQKKGNLTLAEWLDALIQNNKSLVTEIELNIERMKNISYLLQIGIED